MVCTGGCKIPGRVDEAFVKVFTDPGSMKRTELQAAWQVIGGLCGVIGGGIEVTGGDSQGGGEFCCYGE